MATPDRQPSDHSISQPSADGAPAGPTPPILPGALRQPAHRRGPDGLDEYHTVADTVGGLPNLRLRDNVMQTLVVLGGTALFALVGLVLAYARVLDMPPVMGALIGAVAGMILSTLLSGFVLMILGVKRAVTKKRR